MGSCDIIQWLCHFLPANLVTGYSHFHRVEVGKCHMSDITHALNPVLARVCTHNPEIYATNKLSDLEMRPTPQLICETEPSEV